MLVECCDIQGHSFAGEETRGRETPEARQGAVVELRRDLLRCLQEHMVARQEVLLWLAAKSLHFGGASHRGQLITEQLFVDMARYYFENEKNQPPAPPKGPQRTRH